MLNASFARASAGGGFVVIPAGSLSMGPVGLCMSEGSGWLILQDQLIRAGRWCGVVMR